MKVLMFVLALTNFAATIRGQNFSDVKNLTQVLFQEYDTRIRPIQNQADPIEVVVDFNPLAINDLDEVSETMKLTGYLTLSWVDEFLTWNPDDYGGLQYYLWPQSTIWKPDISLGNSINEYKELGVMTLNMEVDYQGNVVWKPFEVFRSTCSFDTTNFPFDVQTCSLDFLAWSYSKAEVTMTGGFTGIDLHKYTPSSTWTLLDTSWSVEQNFGESSIKYSFKVKRKPLFFILSIIIPIILLAFLNLSVFALPCESGERAGFSVTVFLALAVFLTIVSENLPKNSDKVSIFAIYMIILTMQSTVITIVGMMTIRWSHNSDTTPIPKWMLSVANCLRRCTFSRKVSDNSDVGHKHDGAVETASDGHITDQEYKSSPVNHFKATDETCDTETTPGGMKKQMYTWTEIVRAMDVLFFIVFFFFCYIYSDNYYLFHCEQCSH